MASKLHSSLLSRLNELCSSLESQRTTELSKVKKDTPKCLPALPEQRISVPVGEAWEASWTEYTDTQSLENAKPAELVRSVLDLLGRDLVLSPIINGEVSSSSSATGSAAVSLFPEILRQNTELQLSDEDEMSPVDSCRFQTIVQDRLDVILTLYEIVFAKMPDVAILEPGAIFIPLLEELVELVSVESWRSLWDYVESRSKRFTKDMPASRGKALPLLRTINAFLRFLPRTPADLVFRGRVHQFASSVISVADKSAINMRGDYNDIKTIWEPPSVPSPSPPIEDKPESTDQDLDGDVKMDASPSKPGSTDKEEKEPESKFYETLWSLQQYFSHPPSLDGAPSGDPAQSPFEHFKTKSDYVLPKLFEQTQKERGLMGKEAESGLGQKRKRDADDGGFFHPRYLTGKKLLEHELADPSFRRQILVQYFILFQFLLNLTPSSVGKQAFTGGMPKSFVIVAEDESWVKNKVSAIREELRKMYPDGPRFEETVLSIITRERYYAQWKNDGCPEKIFEVPPVDNTSAKEAADLWKRRLAPPPAYPFKLGSRPLSKLWNRGFKDINQLKAWRRATTYQSLDEEVLKIEMDEEDDKAMGIEMSPEKAAENAEIKLKATWRALRLASHTELRHFTTLAPKRDIHVLVKAVKDAEATRAAAIQAAAAGGATPGEAAAQAEAEAEEETKSEVDEVDKPPEGVEGAEGNERAEDEGEDAVETVTEPVEPEMENEEAKEEVDEPIGDIKVEEGGEGDEKAEEAGEGDEPKAEERPEGSAEEEQGDEDVKMEDPENGSGERRPLEADGEAS